MERINFPGEPASARDRIVIERQLGRDPRGDLSVAARCEYGLPVVVRTPPKLETGEPFPTLFYLTCPMAVRAVGRLEANGTMRAYEERLEHDEALRARYGEAHERYRALRDSLGAIDSTASAGGMPARVKCLHALYAHELADANPIGMLVRDEIEPLGCPGPCVNDDGDRVRGHPGFAGKKKHR